jgi:hypothetical protein
MMTTVEGTYRNGKVELRETPPRPGPARVLVTFLPDGEPPVPAGTNLYGAFPGPGVTNDEDFKLAEWRPTDRELNGD